MGAPVPDEMSVVSGGSGEGREGVLMAQSVSPVRFQLLGKQGHQGYCHKIRIIHNRTSDCILKHGMLKIV